MNERRRLVAALIATLVVVPLGVAYGGHPGRTEACVRPAVAVRIGDTIACEHSDEAPPGVDIYDPVSVAELRDRPGAGAAAYEAAADLGVPTPTSVAASATGTAVPCDGDGTSGYRVQAMYVVEAGRANRYAALLPSLRLWAAGTDDVVNRSAALTGGVRHIRYVTAPGSGSTCVAAVLNVTVPAGSMTTFGATMAAVQALGYTNPARKYLMWTDANVLCGVASLYNSDGPAQSNPNNGAYPQYARIDSGCWGFGDGSGEHSVEAHELMHTLGGVQNSAPHSTKAGHCWDESDTMCYSDGGGYAMKQVCPASKEFFFDCNNDDYFSTYPQSGTYLTTHWNTADSRFLLGGGDGSGGGTLGSPTTLGATIAVNNPAVPGLATQVSVAPVLPNGRQLTRVTWTSARSDCTFGTPNAVQSTVTCAATTTAATTVTATLVDSTGATKAATSPLTFASGTARPVAVGLSAAGQSTADGSTASVCTNAGFPVTATVVDVASGVPVKGLPVSFTKQTSGLLGTLGSILSTLLGSSSVTQVVTVPTTYAASTTAGTVYAAGISPTLAAVPGSCSVDLSGTVDRSTVYYGDAVAVTGRATRQVAGRTVPVIGLNVPVTLTTVAGAVTKVTTLGTAVTGTDGTYSASVKPLVAGTISAEVPGSIGYAARRTVAGTVAVLSPRTTLTAAVDQDDVGYGTPVTVTGTLVRAAGSATSPLRGTVTLWVTPPGRSAVKVGSGATTPTGSYRVSVPLKVSGALAARYAGAAGQPAATAEVGPVTAGTWTTRMTSAASSMTIGKGAATTITGTVTKTYAGVTKPANGLKVSLYLSPAGSTGRSLLGAATTTTTGTFSTRVRPASSGTLAAMIAAVTGYTEASAEPFPITVQ
ncbi:MAG: hypothetical protein JWQ74_3303 [Marmoricola sp.]|nr:hypothetical protein [Marmoricola sp.]